MEIPEVDEQTFRETVIQSSGLVLVDFSAVWCSPCQLLDPIVEQLADEWDGRVKIVKLDVDNNPNLAMQFQVLGVPTLMLFKDGKVRERLTGYQPKDRILARLKPYIPEV